MKQQTIWCIGGLCQSGRALNSRLARQRALISLPGSTAEAALYQGRQPAPEVVQPEVKPQKGKVFPRVEQHELQVVVVGNVANQVLLPAEVVSGSVGSGKLQQWQVE
eukprot:613655-Lingulodinium_polyedra.AAC.1